jgi:hypothetical protein
MAKKKHPYGDQGWSREENDRLANPSAEEENEEWEELPVKRASTGLAGVIEKLRKNPWVKKNPQLAAGAAGGVALLLMALFVGWQMGWFSSGKGNKRQSSAVAAQPVPPPPALTPPAGPPTPGEQPKPPQPNPGEEPKKEEPKKPEKLPLPDDVAKWKRADYLRARAENDPKLLNAVEYLGAKFAGSEPAAQGLADLLKPLKVDPAPAGQPPGAERPRNPAESTKLVETIIVALGSNGSAAAKSTLEQILSGTLPTEDDKTAVEAALKTLIANPSPEGDALLLRALTAADALRPADRQGPWPAKELRAKAMELVKPAASENLRQKLAEALAERFAKLDAQDPMRELLSVTDPLNCRAQIVLYEGATAKDVKLKLEQQLLGYASTAMARMLGISEGAEEGVAVAVSPAASGNKPDLELGSRLAAQLWSDKFLGLVEPQLADLRSFDKQSQLVLLAGTIPLEPMRAALAKQLLPPRKHWIDGPKALETAGLFDKVVTDPGLLVLVKMLPRKEAKGARAPADTLPRPGKSGRTPVTPPAGKTGAAGKVAEAQKKQQAEQDWMTCSSKMVALWCKRFCAVAQAREKAAVESGKPAPDLAAPKLPSEFELDPDAKVTAAYHLVWPDDAPAALGSAKPGSLEIHYLRIEETSKPKRLISFYKKVLAKVTLAKVTDVRTSDKSAWIDSLRPGSQKDRRRSVDVLISRAPGEQGGDLAKDDEDAELVVEILAVEIKDPAKE